MQYNTAVLGQLPCVQCEDGTSVGNAAIATTSIKCVWYRHAIFQNMNPKVKKSVYMTLSPSAELYH